MIPELPLAVLLAPGTGTLALYSPLAPQLWCLWLTPVGQPCLFPLPQCHRLPCARGAGTWCLQRPACGMGMSSPSCASESHPKATVPALYVEEGREGRVARGGGFIGLAKHTERRANSLGSLRLPGPSVCCPCQIIQPHKYKSSQAQREEDSCWASYTFLERIKAIQSSSLLH